MLPPLKTKNEANGPKQALIWPLYSAIPCIQQEKSEKFLAPLSASLTGQAAPVPTPPFHIPSHIFHSIFHSPPPPIQMPARLAEGQTEWTGGEMGCEGSQESGEVAEGPGS